jgi:hypothetical protein
MNHNMTIQTPKDYDLPFNISSFRPLKYQGIGSVVWEVAIEDKRGGLKPMVLKKFKDTRIDAKKELERAKEFYDFLKNHPKFKKCVINTQFFLGQLTAERKKHLSVFALQEKAEGKRIDKASDDELYENKTIIKQLLEFIDASTGILREAKKAGKNMPDFYGDEIKANFLCNPRFSSNIIVLNKADKDGRRIVFVDVSPQIQQTKGIGKIFQEYIGSNLQIYQLNRWKKKILGA